MSCTKFCIIDTLQNFEEWERQKQEADMEHYIWENNPSKKAYVTLTRWPEKVSDDDVKSHSIDDDMVGQKYKEAVTELLNNGKTNICLKSYSNLNKISYFSGEDTYTLNKYREAVLAVLLPQTEQA